jgi:hypothetical protein
VARTLFAVAKDTAGAANKAIFELNNQSGAGAGTAYQLDRSIAVRVSSGSRQMTVTTGTTAFRILTCQSAASANVSAAIIRMDGTILTQTSVTAQSINTGATGAAIGHSESTATYWTGDIAEVFGFNAELSTLEIQRMEWYLADRYAISGPTDPDAGDLSPFHTMSYRVF